MKTSIKFTLPGFGKGTELGVNICVVSPSLDPTTTTTTTTIVVTISTKNCHLLSICCEAGIVSLKSLGRICAEPHNSLDEAEQEFAICQQ